MKAFLKALAKEGVLSIVVLVLLCVLVWFGGSLFADEDNDLVKIRIIIIVVLLSIWVIPAISSPPWTARYVPDSKRCISQPKRSR